MVLAVEERPGREKEKTAVKTPETAELAERAANAESSPKLQNQTGDKIDKDRNGPRNIETAEQFRLQEKIRRCPTVSPDELCGDVIALFRRSADSECIVVCDENDKPLGLVMKHRFFRMLGTLYGMSLYGEKPISKLMDSEPYIADCGLPAQELIDRAMSRPEEHVYDTVIMSQNDVFAGILTVNDLLGISRLLQREASGRQIRTVRDVDGMIGDIHGAVEKVAETAELSRRSSERIAEATENGKAELSQILSLLHVWTSSADRQDKSVTELLQRTNEAFGITRMIAELADQCNLLAINAQIEAARAGEHGRGFAVVAQEVKALADQTKDSTERIKRQLSDMAQAAEAAARAVRDGKLGAEEGIRHVHLAEAKFNELWDISGSNLEAASKLNAASAEAKAISGQIRGQIRKLTQQLNGTETDI
ncbi:methyl-accepting chemotaxis protein [Cohnella massiliensis]|uniref:methyl-accepting chemotaxis protein n=1 Tax=Cohnella massiliensis TaxID=1816691 RepID=UPI0009BA9BD2|nr:methyl-accepting chemotaxis protein [Cohnella massiliensis]